MSPDQEYGSFGEKWVFDQLKQRGYSPKINSRYFAQNCDLFVLDMPVEVKIARQTNRRHKLNNGLDVLYPRWQWSVHDTAKEMNGEWILVLLAQTKTRIFPYILPGSVIGDRNHLQITSHPDRYQGWLNQYRDKWSIIDYLAQQTYLDNGPTFQEWAASQKAVA